MPILAGTASEPLAQKIAEILHEPLLTRTTKRFPDTEFYIRIHDDITNEHIIIVQTTYPDPNLVELFIMQNAVHEAGGKKITVVIPYFGYNRQDKKFEPGEPISAQALAQLISINASTIITVDPHKDHLLQFFTVPAYGCSAVAEIATYLKKKDIDFILAPDKGAKNRAKHAAKIIGCDYDYIEKTRIDGTTVTMKPKHLDAKGKNVAIIDDIISTGGTMAQSIRELKRQKANRVTVACTHGLFIGDAQQKLTTAGCDEIIATDTIQSNYSTVSVAPCIAELLKKQVM
ncbi:MAG: ribose-phosphate diphosphokinase [Candidatus Thermoplasmatota archaeon]